MKLNYKKEKLFLPDLKLLKKTGKVDYYYWNYRFPIKLLQKYRFKRIIGLLGPEKFPNLLEVGTGSGIFLPELSRHCDTLYACDIHTDNNYLEKLCNHYKLRNYFISQQNIEKTSYPDNSFDAIIAVSVLEFVSDLQQSINEILRILKPNGIFITICPMQNKFLDLMLSFYTSKKPKEEFGNSRIFVSKKLEENFKIQKKGYMVPFFGKWFPIYTHYVLSKN